MEPPGCVKRCKQKTRKQWAHGTAWWLLANWEPSPPSGRVGGIRGFDGVEGTKQLSPCCYCLSAIVTCTTFLSCQDLFPQHWQRSLFQRQPQNPPSFCKPWAKHAGISLCTFGRGRGERHGKRLRTNCPFIPSSNFPYFKNSNPNCHTASLPD